MDKHNDESRLIPFSSDEGPNSADDSEEDVITDYLPPCDNTMAQRRAGPLVPTISVTPHSPGTRHYPILEDNLQHLHEIHESIQQMRDLSAQVLNSQMMGLSQYARLSTSCPSLNNELGPDPDLGSMNSSPTQTLAIGTFNATGFMDLLHGKANPHEWLMCRGPLDEETPRRRSWTAIEDLSQSKEKHKSKRQRSMSLSSLDSEPDDSFLDQVDSAGSTGLLVSDANSLGCPTGSRRAPRTGGTASTHSLNEADLQSDFSKIVAKREAENLRLPPARLPLQKSVSTPSIITVRDIGNENNTETNASTMPP